MNVVNSHYKGYFLIMKYTGIDNVLLGTDPFKC